MRVTPADDPEDPGEEELPPVDEVPTSADIEQQLDSYLALPPLATDVAELKRLTSTAAQYSIDASKLAQAYTNIAAAEEAQKLASAGTQCEFYFVLADKVKEFRRSMPIFQDVRSEHPDWIVRRTCTFADAIAGKYRDEYLSVSHRWEMPDDPDTNGAQLQALKDYLAANPQIVYVWFDYTSMPQKAAGVSTAMAREFKTMLANVNILYLGCAVLAIVDLTYISRFWVNTQRLKPWTHATRLRLSWLASLLACLSWLIPSSMPRVWQTQFEAWLGMQEADAGGLHGAPESRRRLTVRCIHNANQQLMQAMLVDMWATRSPEEAREVLARPDVSVTNQSDKDTQLAKLLRFNERTIAAFPAVAETRLAEQAKAVATTLITDFSNSFKTAPVSTDTAEREAEEAAKTKAAAKAKQQAAEAKAKKLKAEAKAQEDKLRKEAEARRTGGLKIHAARYGWAPDLWKAALGSGSNHAGGAKDVTGIVKGMVANDELHINPDRKRQYMNRTFWKETAHGPPIPRKLAVRFSYGDGPHCTIETPAVANETVRLDVTRSTKAGVHKQDLKQVHAKQPHGAQPPQSQQMDRGHAPQIKAQDLKGLWCYCCCCPPYLFGLKCVTPKGEDDLQANYTIWHLPVCCCCVEQRKRQPGTNSFYKIGDVKNVTTYSSSSKGCNGCFCYSKIC